MNDACWTLASARLVPTLALVLHALPAFACSVAPGWTPLTPEAAFESAQVVVHARVLSRVDADDLTVTVEVLGVLKGTFSGNVVRTASGSMCGMLLANGIEYVFFFARGDGYFVTSVSQPAGMTADQVLSSLPRTAHPIPGAHIAERSWPSGQYFQFGYRGPTTPTTNDRDPLVDLQIDLGTQENCEARLARVSGSVDVAEVLGRNSFWCAAESASAGLGYFAVFRNKATGRSLRFEYAHGSLCTIAVEAQTNGLVPDSKLEVTSACRAK